MEELRFEIAEDMEDERIDKCISLLRNCHGLLFRN